jgi:5-methylcytosine-specific restriction enzyme A
VSGGWKDSDRHDRLPDNWAELTRIIHDRSGYRCEFKLPSGGRCPRRADGGVDHIERGDDHRIENLRDSCKAHHGRKSSQEGHDAKAALKAAGLREPEVNPRRRVR